MRPGEGFPSSKKNNSANFSGEKNYNEAFRGVYFCKVRKKPFPRSRSLKVSNINNKSLFVM